MDRSTHEVRIKEWTKIIQDCNASGLTKRQWCLQNQINEKQFYYWQRVIRRKVLSETQLTEVSEHPVAATTFVELSAAVTQLPDEKPAGTMPSAVIRLSNGISVELSDTASATFIRQIIGTLAYAE